MEPLLNQLNEKATLKVVEEHLNSLLRIRHFYDVVDVEEVDLSFYVSRRTQRTSIENRMLKKIVHTDNVNRITKEYLEKMMTAINNLDAYDRQLLFLKYFDEMDEEEISEELQYCSRTIWKDLKKAKINLAFKLGCEQYMEK